MSDSAGTPPTIEDAKAFIERLRPRERARLRPWVLARFDVSGNVHPDIVSRELDDEPHRLRR